MIRIPLLDLLVFTSAEEEMRLRHKLKAHDAVIVGKHRPVTVTKVKTPDLDVTIRRSGHNESTVLCFQKQSNGL